MIIKDFEAALDVVEIIESRRVDRAERDDIINQSLLQTYCTNLVTAVKSKRIKPIGSLTERLLSESIKKQMVDKIKESAKPVNIQQLQSL